MESPKEPERDHGEGERWESHLIVNKNERLLLQTATPRFLNEMLTDCAVNHANESSAARGLMCSAPCAHTAAGCLVSSGVSRPGGVLRHFLAEIVWPGSVMTMRDQFLNILKNYCWSSCVLQRTASASALCWRCVCAVTAPRTVSKDERTFELNTACFTKTQTKRKCWSGQNVTVVESSCGRCWVTSSM